MIMLLVLFCSCFKFYTYLIFHVNRLFYLEFFSYSVPCFFQLLVPCWTLLQEEYLITVLLDSTDKVNSVFSFLQLMDNDKMTQTGEQFKKGNLKLILCWLLKWSRYEVKSSEVLSLVQSLQPHGLWLPPCSRQEYWSGLHVSFSEDLQKPRIEPGSLTLIGRCFTGWNVCK